MPRSNESVFINVPFDRAYQKLFHALVFSVHECGFIARCALEGDDGSEVRMEKLYNIIRDSPLGIHDLSRVTLDSANRLPRFNMPLELGVFLGAKRYGDQKQRAKSCLSSSASDIAIRSFAPTYQVKTFGLTGTGSKPQS